MISTKRISVNGRVVDHAATFVNDADQITVDGQPVGNKAATRLWRYHKPMGLVTTHRDEQGRPTVFNALPPQIGRVISIGRLDLNSEGLLLLTNDGMLARKLEQPSNGWVRRYRARVHGEIDPANLARLARGVSVDGTAFAPIYAEMDDAAARADNAIRLRPASNAWLTVRLSEGKNREVRKALESIGLTVNRLIRTAYGPFQLGNLPRGSVSEVRARVLADQVGGESAAVSGSRRRRRVTGAHSGGAS
jgi:23S rRNA pseudouridine2605 synthase